VSVSTATETTRDESDSIAHLQGHEQRLAAWQSQGQTLPVHHSPVSPAAVHPAPPDLSVAWSTIALTNAVFVGLFMAALFGGEASARRRFYYSMGGLGYAAVGCLLPLIWLSNNNHSKSTAVGLVWATYGLLSLAFYILTFSRKYIYGPTSMRRDEAVRRSNRSVRNKELRKAMKNGKLGALPVNATDLDRALPYRRSREY
jgi:hypothetical protein